MRAPDPADYGPTPAPVLPMPDLVTYQCTECPASFSHREPFEAHGLYLDHLAEHDPEPFSPADLARLEDEGARHVDDVGDASHWSDGTEVDPAELAAQSEVPD